MSSVLAGLESKGIDVVGIRSEVERYVSTFMKDESGRAMPFSKQRPPSIAVPEGVAASAEESRAKASDAPLAAAEAALAAAEEALAREEGIGLAAARSAPGGGEAPESLRRQLDGVLAACKGEQVGRAALAKTVRDLEERLNTGLASIGEVAAARMATDSATELMLGALRKCVDELSEQCAWPAGHAGAAGGQQPAASLAAVVLQQAADLKEMRSAQVELRAGLQAQQDEQRRWMTACTECQEQHAEQTSVVAANLATLQARHESVMASLETLTSRVAEVRGAHAEGARAIEEQVKALSSRLDTQEASAAERASSRAAVQALEQQLGRLVGEQTAVMERLQAAEQQSLAALGDGQLMTTVKAVESQLRVLQAEKRQVADALLAMGEQQQQLRAMQQKVLSAAEESAAASQGGAALETSVKALEQQLQQLRGSGGEVAETLRSLREQQEAVHAAQRSHEDALKSIAETVQEQKSESSQQVEASGSSVVELREEVAAVANAVNMLFGRVNDLEGQKDPKEKLQSEVATIANVVRALAERVNRMECVFRIDRGHKEPRSPNSQHGGSDAGSEAAATPQSQRSSKQPSPPASRARSHHNSATLPSVQEEPSRAPQAAASSAQDAAAAQDAPQASSSSKKAPSPRNWLVEPLSVSIARFDADYPTSLQSTLHTAPSLGSTDLLTRRAAAANSPVRNRTASGAGSASLSMSRPP